MIVSCEDAFDVILCCKGYMPVDVKTKDLQGA